MRYPFCPTIKDTETGSVLVYDLECEVEISLDTDGVSPVVDGVYLNGQSLLASPDTLAQSLGHRIADAAEAELEARGALYESVTRAEFDALAA